MDLTTLVLAKNYTDKQIEQAEMGDIELDTTLAKAGFAADSATVGQKFEDLKKRVETERVILPGGTDQSDVYIQTAHDDQGTEPEVVIGQNKQPVLLNGVKAGTRDNHAVNLAQMNNAIQAAAPTVVVEQTEDGAKIIATGKNGVTSATVANGNIGPAGPAGPQGETGPQGEKGEKGDSGDDGKTAYEYAQAAGYTGTEEEFSTKLAQETYTKEQIDAIMGLYINDIDALVGGES